MLNLVIRVLSESNEKDLDKLELIKDEILEEIIKKAYKDERELCNFSFEGREPLLAGEEFFKKVLKLQKKYNKKSVKTLNSIESKGLIIDESFAKFLAENEISIVFSIESNEIIENGDKLLKFKDILDSYVISYNINTLVKDRESNKAVKIYEFYKENDIDYVNLIPYFNKGLFENKDENLLSTKGYSRFLKGIFDLWYKDYKKGKRNVNIRFFDNIIAIILAYPAENCELRGYCSIGNIISSKGDIYPCSHYLGEENKIANIKEVNFKELIKRKEAISFVKEGLVIKDKCKVCRYAPICKGGCKRYKVNENKDFYYCESFVEFFDYSIDKFIEIAKEIMKSK